MLPTIFCIKFSIINKYYPDEPVFIYMQSLINIMHEKKWVITTKKGKGKLPLFCGNGERVITIYASEARKKFDRKASVYQESIGEILGSDQGFMGNRMIEQLLAIYH